MNEEALHIIVHGRVQGVFFRASTQERGRDLGLCGWVRNRVDGTVEIHAEGEKQSLDRFAQWCRQGPPAARVEQLETKTVPPEGMSSFKIM
ncbi:MAG: acylphosphatase [Nitrospinota bacterium]|nr:acylphosphatase [Nitrospinota bacterium]